MTPSPRHRSAARGSADTGRRLPVGIAAAQQLIISAAEDDIALLETALWRWLTHCSDRELEQLLRWLTHTGHTWTRRLAATSDDRQLELDQLGRITDDTSATHAARAARSDIRDTWHRFMRAQPVPRPIDALTAARGIHA